MVGAKYNVISLKFFLKKNVIISNTTFIELKENPSLTKTVSTKTLFFVRDLKIIV